MGTSTAIDIGGQKFGKWTVLERAGEVNRQVTWKCRCECGTEKVVRGNSLRSGTSTSCGLCFERYSPQREKLEAPPDRAAAAQRMNRYWRVMLYLRDHGPVHAMREVSTVPVNHKEFGSAMDQGYIQRGEQGLYLTELGRQELEKKIDLYASMTHDYFPPTPAPIADEIQKLVLPPDPPRIHEEKETFNILGQEMTTFQIKESFGVRPSEFYRRVERRGICPTDAALSPTSKFQGASVGTCFMSGWAYWCEKLALPLVETTMLYREEDPDKANWMQRMRRTSLWKFKDESYRQTLSSGVETLGLSLMVSHADSVGIMAIWVGAVLRTWELTVMNFGSKHAHETEELIRNYFHPDPRARNMLPPLSRESSALLDKLSRKTWERLHDNDYHRVSNYFELLGLAAHARKAVREEYLVLNDDEYRQRINDIRLDERLRRERGTT